MYDFLFYFFFAYLQICVGTISRVVGRLLKVHFDGWEDDYDQWMDCESVDIYPVGWAELVGHKLEGPRLAMPAKKEKKKAVGKRGKKRSHNNSSSNGGLSPGSALSQVCETSFFRHAL